MFQRSRVVCSCTPPGRGGLMWATVMLERLRAERARITATAAELQEAGRKLDLLIELAADPGAAHCPASLDE
ncbi:hypothetical protein ACFU8Q_37840 [Streptomyces sp. NPDC057543]|uniref:hypothetical protein n=1 Tax=Streptomyces sp. NPDC057543 TaxID=3346163 RepID=UPI0036C6EA2B